MNKAQALILNEPSFQARFGNVFRSVFCGHEASRSSFVSQDWNFILLPFQFVFPDSEFRCLAAAGEICGDEEFVATSVETVPPHQFNCVLPWDKNAMADVPPEGRLGVFTTAIFGRSAMWGAICSTDDFSILGGKSRFMESFIECSGGVNRLRSQFLDELDLWYVAKDLRDEFRRNLLSQVGWE